MVRSRSCSRDTFRFHAEDRWSPWGTREWPVGERKASPHPRNVSGACRWWWCVSHGWTQTETPRTRHRVSPSLHRPSRCLFLEPSPSPSFSSGAADILFPPLPSPQHVETAAVGSASWQCRHRPIAVPDRQGQSHLVCHYHELSPYWSHNEPDCSCGIKKFVLGLNHPRLNLLRFLPLPPLSSLRLLRGLHPPLRPSFYPGQPSPAARIMSLN